MDYFIPKQGATPAFGKSILVLPQPSLASLPQLAADLIIHTLKLELVGYLGLQDFVPAVSGLDSSDPAAPAPEGICFAVEVFQNKARTVTVVLPRSPVIRARKPHHAASIEAFATAAGFSEILIVASIDAATRGDDGLREPTPLRHYILSSTSSSSSPDSPLLKTLSTLAPPYVLPSTSTSSAPSTILPLFPHAGQTRNLFSAFLAATPAPAAPVAALLIYASEGDNEQSAEFLAEALVRVVGVQDERKGEGWTRPGSWEVGLMGMEMGRERQGEMFG
ncbi:hypothetical protein RQP46_009116 [Phenoliferia psychrophenolica]